MLCKLHSISFSSSSSLKDPLVLPNFLTLLRFVGAGIQDLLSRVANGNIESFFLQVLSETSSSRPGGYRLFLSSRPPTEMKQSGLGMVFQLLSSVVGKGCLSVLQSFTVGIGVIQSELSGGAREDEFGEAIFRCEL